MYDYVDLKNDNVIYFKNCISLPNKYIEFLEELNENKNSHEYIEKWKTWTASNDSSNIYGEKKTISNFKNFKLSDDQNLNKRMLYLINSVKETIFILSNRISNNVLIKDSFSINKYYSDKNMGPHVDSYNEENFCNYTFLIYLNDDYEGGEIEFTELGIKIKPEAGSALIFPTTKPYFHQAHENKNGFKYFVTTEICIVEEK